VFLHEVAVVLLGSSLELIVELDAGASDCPKKVGRRDSNGLSMASCRLEKKKTRQQVIGGEGRAQLDTRF